MTEAELMTAIRKRLCVYQLCGEVDWFLRIQSGKIEKFGKYIQLAPKGTPDWLVLVRNKVNGITAIFIEAKSSAGKQTQEQIDFQIKYHNDKDILYYVINDISQLSGIINNIAFDRTTLLPEEL